MDWIHCNSCSIQPGEDKARKFQLTSCGHMYCSMCVENCTKPSCKVCGTACKSVLLTSQMAPEIQTYFSDPEEMIRKALQIASFQKGHRQRFAGLRSRNNSQLAALTNENKTLRAKVIDQAKHIAKLEAKMQKMRQMFTMNTPALSQISIGSPAITPSMNSPASVCSMNGSRHSAFEKRISPNFAGGLDMGYVSQPSLSGSRRSPAGFSRFVQQSDAARQKSSPRERFMSLIASKPASRK